MPSKALDDKYLRGLREGVKHPMSLATYLNRLEQLRKQLGTPLISEVLVGHVESHVKALRATEAKRSLMTTTNLVASVLACFKHNPPASAVARAAQAKWAEYHAELKRAELSAYKRNEPINERQERNYVSISEVEECVKNELRDGHDAHASLKDSQAVLLLAFYAHVPPKRSDYGSLHVLSSKSPPPESVLSTVNYVMMGTRPSVGPTTLVLNNHKTASVHRSIVEELPLALDAVLRASLARWPRKFVFVDRSGRPFSNSAFGKYVARTFAAKFNGRAAGTSLLRHAYITERVDFNNMSMEEREEIARRMGHTVSTQEVVYKWVKRKSVDGSAKP